MPYLINLSGRLVAVAEDSEAQYLLKKGFTIPPPEVVEDHIRAKMGMVTAMNLPPPREASVYFCTVSQGRNGYGVSSDKIVQELNRLDVQVSLYQKNQKIGILFHTPYSILRMENDFRIIYTMFESSKIPPDWKDYLDAADLIIVPSKWNQKVFKDSGFDTHVIPLGYDDKVFTYVERQTAHTQKRPFTFLHYDAFNARKGFMEVWQAFNEEFGKETDVRLILKTCSDNPPLPITKSSYPNVDVISGEIDEKSLMDILKEGDCFVFPSRGEGFGMTPLEAMATGMPAIIPNAHGISEYFNPDMMYEVKIEGETPALYGKRYREMDVGNMVKCSVADLRRQMRYVYAHQDEALRKGREAAAYVKKFTFANTASKLKAVIDQYITKSPDNKPLKNLLVLEEVR